MADKYRHLATSWVFLPSFDCSAAQRLCQNAGRETQAIPSVDNQPRRSHTRRLHRYQRIDIRKFGAFGKDIAEWIIQQMC
jgi:hypothetical protein